MVPSRCGHDAATTHVQLGVFPQSRIMMTTSNDYSTDQPVEVFKVDDIGRLYTNRFIDAALKS